MAARKSNPNLKNITFTLNAPDANQVMLAGDFNNWDFNSTSLKKGKDKVWKKDVSLKPGRYEYKFVVDGSWISDPTNENKCISALGSENSVLNIE